MAKIIAVIGIFLLMNVAMFVFTFGGECVGDCELSEFNTESGTGIWDFFTNPTNMSTSTFWDKLFGSTLGILTALTTLGGIIALGAAVYYKDINIAYISLSIFLVGGIIGTWIRLWAIINNSGSAFGGSSGGVIVMLLCGVGLSAHLFYLIDWGRGRA